MKALNFILRGDFNLDIEYLVWLQNLRGEVGEGVEKFVTLFTDGSVAATLILSAIIFWCVDKKTGKFLLLVMAFSRICNQILKNTFCVYRPWILDLSVHPVPSVMNEASSYSFPSGHTNIATAVYGGVAYRCWKKFPLIAFLCVVTILLTAFSRNFLGVHTPQDVLTAMLVTSFMIICVDKLMAKIDGDAQKENLITIAGIIFAVIVTAYFMLKSYPVDYLNGKVIVQPRNAIHDAIGSVGTFTGILIGLELERRFVNFKTNVNFSLKICRLIIGVVFIAATNFLLFPELKHLDLGALEKFLRWFLTYIVVIFLVPLAFSQFEGNYHIKQIFSST